MAQFLLAADPDADRRRSFLDRAAPELHPVPGLRTGRANLGGADLAWAADPRAPVRVEPAASAPRACVLGDLLGPAGGAAPPGAERWSRTDPPTPGNGFHLQVRVADDGALLLGADPLGLFPVYWWHQGRIFLAASSPTLILRHPAVGLTPDGRGIAGVLLANGLVGDRTLLHGIRRLRPGRWLVCEPGGAAAEHPGFVPAVSERYAHLSLPAQAAVLHEVLERVFARLAPAGEPLTALLSGGIDSRIVAGFLGERGADVTALTWGHPGDLEMRCARLVADALGFRHVGVDDTDSDAEEAARRTVRLEHLAMGFNSTGGLARTEVLRTLPARLVSGHVLDYVVSTNRVKVPAASDGYDRPRWEDVLAGANAWGVAPEWIRRVVRPEVLGRGVEEALDELEAEYRAWPGDGWHAYWRFALANRGRCHVGGHVWHSSFGAWPALPVLDAELINTMGGMPYNLLNRRLLQRELLLGRFPELAALPFDQNSLDPVYLQPRIRHLLADAARQGIRALRARTPFPEAERRRYHRTYDINGPRWRAIRRAADRCRAEAGEVLDLRALGEALPPAEARIEAENPITGVSGHKLLIGLVLWAAEARRGFRAP